MLGEARHARPSSRWVGVVQLIAHIDRASLEEVVMHSLRAANRNLVTCLVPAVQRSSVERRCMVVENPDVLLILPYCQAGVTLLSLDPLALAQATDLLLGDGAQRVK